MNYLTSIKHTGRLPVREMNTRLRILTQFIGFIRDLLGRAAKKRLISCILFTTAYLHEL